MANERRDQSGLGENGLGTAKDSRSPTRRHSEAELFRDSIVCVKNRRSGCAGHTDCPGKLTETELTQNWTL